MHILRDPLTGHMEDPDPLEAGAPHLYLDIHTYDSRYGVILKQVPDDTQIGCFSKSPHAR